ncbi:MAG: right-handed parallel beta-helix repeat-containing protein [bacterium]
MKKIQQIISIVVTGGQLFSGNIQAGDISGGLSGVLSLANSPYTVTSDVTVPVNQSLVIEPGVILKFNENVSFFIDGTLTAEGTVSDSIRFSSSNSAPNSGDWNGILFRASSVGSIKYAVVDFASTGVTATGASPSITHSWFRNNNNGVDCFSGCVSLIQYNALSKNANSAIRCNASSPTISKNAIFDNEAFESAISCDNASPVITQNVFSKNNNSAIDCINNAAPNIWQNTISENDFGVTITESNPSLRNNIVVLNGFGIQNDNGVPVIAYNDVWSNSSGDFQGTPADVGQLSGTNANGDPADVFFNISLDPKFVNLNSRDFELQADSPCIDAGDPANPAAINLAGSAPDQGVFEFGGTVPVELVSFEFINGMLVWATASETNNFGFEVQRSRKQTGDFVKVGFVPGAGTTVTRKDYEFRDSVDSGVFYYRLKQIDMDGAFKFSSIIQAHYRSPDVVFLAQNYPNPFNASTLVSFKIPVAETGETNVTLRIFNILGQGVVELLNERKVPGEYKLRWNGVDKLGRPVSSGLYFYQLTYGRHVLTRKMLLTE